MKQQLIQQDKVKLTERYKQLIESSQILRHRTTLEMYEIYKEAYKLGKELYGNNFSYRKLSLDFKVTRSSVERIMSLSKATDKHWKLLNDGRISSYKLALILQRKGNTEIADDLIKDVMEKKITVFDINNTRSSTRAELSIERKEKAIKDGYSRKQDAFIGTSKTLSQMDLIVLYPINRYSAKHQKIILNKIKLLKRKLDIYIRRYER